MTEWDGASASLSRVLRGIVGTRLADDERRWLEQRSAEILADRDPDVLLVTLAVAGRKLGKVTVVLEPHERDQLRHLGISWIPASRVHEWGRLFFLVLSYAAGMRPMKPVVESSFLTGDLDERHAVLRSLPLLPAPGEFVPLALEACRSNIQPLFTAISCHNPYPSSYFPDAAFYRMVLKALFLGIPVKTIVGLERRRGVELTRMVLAFASERRAAGRHIPADFAEAISGEGGTPA